MKVSLKSQHLKRYKELAQLLIKYGQSDVVQQLGIEDVLDRAQQKDSNGSYAKPEELAKDLERMGPTYVKLGQVLSSRPDLIPEQYLKALSKLQDSVQPFPFEQVEEIIQSELGARMSKAFSFFDRDPLAAASLGQVHRAALRDGRPVVVKVQRPSIRLQIAEDMEVLADIANFFDEHTKVGRRYQIVNVLEEFRRTIALELDYEREAANLATLAKNLEGFERIHVPLPVKDYTTARVLTMEYVRGVKITRLSPLVRLDINGSQLIDQLFKAYLKQVLVDGIFHADPHPGNVFLTEDGRIALLDLGMVGRTTPAMQNSLFKLLLAVSEGNGEQAAAIAIDISETRDHFDESSFCRRVSTLVAEHRDTSLQEIDVGTTLLHLGRTAGENGLLVPTELSLLAKTLLQLDEIARCLDPQFSPNAAIRRHVTEMMNQRLRKEITPSKLFSSVLDIKDFVGALPARLNRILDAVANAELELKVKARDVGVLLEGFQKIANRITTGVILAALIVGASLLMQVQTSFRIFGYPGFAMLLFLTAGGIGLWLVLSIIVSDHRDKRKHRG